MKFNKTFLALHFIVFLWGLTPVLGKLITLPALQLVWWRLVIALMSLFLYAKFKGIDLKLNLLTRKIRFNTNLGILHTYLKNLNRINGQLKVYYSI